MSTSKEEYEAYLKTTYTPITRISQLEKQILDIENDTGNWHPEEADKVLEDLHRRIRRLKKEENEEK